jgi:hypothetical protein
MKRTLLRSFALVTALTLIASSPALAGPRGSRSSIPPIRSMQRRVGRS